MSRDIGLGQLLKAFPAAINNPAGGGAGELFSREIDSDTYAPCFSLEGVVWLSANRLQAYRN